jgi:SAM-dependent methyltransferase
MPENPHHYTLRKHWEADSDFVWVVEYLRAFGYSTFFRSTRYIQINVNEHFYWTMGAPIPATILINRKVLASDQEKTVAVNAATFDSPRLPDEELILGRVIIKGLGSLVGKDILDIGCGHGLTLQTLGDQLEASRYVGIDPSGRALDHLRRGHPHAHILKTVLYDFVPPESNPDGQYDIVLGLLGVGSYLSDEELLRIPRLLRPGGIAAVMFWRDGYEPTRYATAGAAHPLSHWRDQFTATSRIAGNFVLVVYQS